MWKILQFVNERWICIVCCNDYDEAIRVVDVLNAIHNEKEKCYYVALDGGYMHKLVLDNAVVSFDRHVPNDGVHSPVFELFDDIITHSMPKTKFMKHPVQYTVAKALKYYNDVNELRDTLMNSESYVSGDTFTKELISELLRKNDEVWYAVIAFTCMAEETIWIHVKNSSNYEEINCYVNVLDVITEGYDGIRHCASCALYCIYDGGYKYEIQQDCISDVEVIFDRKARGDSLKDINFNKVIDVLNSSEFIEKERFEKENIKDLVFIHILPNALDDKKCVKIATDIKRFVPEYVKYKELVTIVDTLQY